MSSLLDRYSDKIAGVSSCFDRVIIMGTIPHWCHELGMSHYLTQQGVAFADYTEFAKRLCDQIRNNFERIASENGIAIQYIVRPKTFRKEDRIKEIIQSRGDHPGVVHIFSVIEGCDFYATTYNRTTGKTGLRYKPGKCLHYYVYFIDPEYGLCYLRVPTWMPFRLQFYCNGHNYLANQLKKEHIGFIPLDNTFLRINSFARAQQLADAFSAERLHRALDAFAARYCPAIQLAPTSYHWSIMQAEYATDIIFKQADDLGPIFDELVKTAIHTVNPEQVAMFLAMPLSHRTTAELGTDLRFSRRMQGMRIKHYMHWAAIKMYNKQGTVLRIETTVNDVSQFKHYRTVEHRNGTSETKYAPMQRTIYSLGALRELLLAANNRYLDFISSLDDTSDGQRQVTTIGASTKHNDRSYRGFNLLSKTDLDLLLALVRGESAIAGITNRMLRQALPGKTSAQISYFLKRCRVFGLIKKCAKNYKYYLTKTGRSIVIAALRLRQMVLPQMLSQHQRA